jgi:predicted nucleic acid-binding protein
MKLIVDTGPVISLLLIRKFDLLPTLFPEFYLPKAVFEELTKHQEIFVFKNELTYLEKRI